MEFPGDRFDRTFPTTATDVVSEAFRIERIVGQKGQVFGPYLTAVTTGEATDFQLQVDASIAA